MLTPYSNPFSSPLLPDSLQQLISSRAPGNKLAVTITDTRPAKNGQKKNIEDAWLTEQELQQLNRFSFAKRRAEWLSGRICAKQAALELLNGSNADHVLQPHDIVIETNHTGRPHLRPDGNITGISDIDISISHSHDMAISIAGNGLCGVDIQLLNDTLFRVKQRYCADFEAGILDDITGDEQLQLGLLWVSKEAIRKCLSSIKLLGFMEIKLEGSSIEQGYRMLHFNLEEPFSGIGSLSVTTHVHGTYALAVCSISRERLDA
jgi:phosphopantetheinyl transferase